MNCLSPSKCELAQHRESQYCLSHFVSVINYANIHHSKEQEMFKAVCELKRHACTSAYGSI